MATNGWTLDSKWTRIPVLKEGGESSNGPTGVGLFVADSRRNSSLGRLTFVGILVLLTLMLFGAICFLLQQTAVLRLETERLKLRVRVVELQVQRCNALLQDGEAGDGWLSQAEASPRQSSAARRTEAADSEAEQGDGPASVLSSPSFAPSPSSSSSSSSLLAKPSSSSSPSVSPWRRKRNAANNKNPKKENPKKENPKKPKPQKEFAFGFETERPVACKMSNCQSLTGWKPSPWVDAAQHRLYHDLSGKLDIPADGVHYIYAQVTYETVSALEAFAIMVDNEQLARCLTGVDYVNPSLKTEDNVQRKTCHTGLAVHLRKGQKIWIKSLHMDGEQLSVVSMKHSSFWGVVKLSAK